MQIASLLAQLPPDEAAQTMVDLANLRGGPDNITVIIAKVTGPPIAAGEATQVDSDAAANRRNGVWPWWIVGGCLLLAAVAAATVQWWPLAALLAVAAATIIAWRFIRGQSPEMPRPEQPLGRAPYRAVAAIPDAHFAGELSDLARQLCHVAQEEQWEISHDDLESRLEKANDAARRNDFTSAVVGYADVVRYVMRLIRTHHSQRASDSSLDLP